MQTLLGNQVHSIKIIPDTLFETVNQEIVADKVVINLGEKVISISPLINTDELNIQVIKTSNYIQEKGLKPILEHYNDSKLSYTWEGVNTNGYKDVFMMAFDYLTPNLMILSEGSVLKLLEIKAVVQKAKKKL